MYMINKIEENLHFFFKSMFTLSAPNDHCLWWHLVYSKWPLSLMTSCLLQMTIVSDDILSTPNDHCLWWHLVYSKWPLSLMSSLYVYIFIAETTLQIKSNFAGMFPWWTSSGNNVIEWLPLNFFLNLCLKPLNHLT
jgi:hypothetical protein